jgi:mRNA-degrading endonuclease toxin of MazEF toxin-antitoxin module
VNLGDVYRVEFPPRNCHVQAGRRPAIVAQDASATSVALVFQLTVLDQRVLTARIGRVSRSVHEAVWAALDELTGRNDSGPAYTAC